MKNPINTHKNHQNRIDEIFGKIAKFFSSSNKNDGLTGSYKKKGTTSLINLSNKDKEEFAKKADAELQLKIQNEKNKLLDPSFCDPNYVEKSTKEKNNKKPVKKGRISYLSGGGISINGDKNIIDYSDVYIENTIRGEGMGSFRKMGVKDFVCYDINRDLYGIGWLFHDGASYDAKKISGKLYANRFNQPLNFDGEWYTGKFYGKFAGSKALNRIKPSLSKNEILNKFKSLQELIKQTKINFDSKFKFENFDELENRIKKSDNKKLINFIPELYRIKKYLSTIELKQGMGGSSYIKSDEIYKIKSKIDQNGDLDDISSEIDDLFKYFKMIDSKINNFYDELKSLSKTSNPSITV
jgi:hypothetical protein